MILNRPLPQQRYIWGRRQSRPLTDKQRQAMDTLWHQVGLTVLENPLPELSYLFSFLPQEIWLEVGFGGGEHLATQAVLHPTIGFIGCEPFVNGVASLLVHIQKHSLTNVRIVKDDVRLLLARLPAHSLSRVFILFPDPWPKNRHHKRRIIQEGTIKTLAHVLKNGGLLYMATDDPSYARWMQDLMKQHPLFVPLLEGRKNVYERPKDWPLTRYEQKGLFQGRTPVYLTYKT